MTAYRRPFYPPRLTKRRRQVIAQIATGKTYQEIGKTLHLESDTVRGYALQLRRLAQVPSNVALVVWALRWGVLDINEIELESTYTGKTIGVQEARQNET